jgi:hypothetical protein
MAPLTSKLGLGRWLAPLLFFQFYLSITVWLFFYGPWPWDVDQPGLLFAYLAAAQVCIAAGYLLAWRRVGGLRMQPARIEAEVVDGIAFLKVALVVTAVLALPSSMSRTGAWIPDVAAGIDNTGLAYNENFERLTAGNAFVVVEYLRMLFSPWLIALFPLTVLYWARLSWRCRFAALALIAFNLAMYVGTGTNKGIADVVITLPWLVFLAMSTGLLRTPRLGWKLSVASAVMLFAFLNFFGASQTQRSGSGSEYGTFFTGAAVVQADSGHFISALLPEEFRLVFEALSRYVVHGYYALSLALQTDSPSTWGFGHSMFLARNADLVFGTNHFVWNSLPGLLERDHLWGMYLLWHSIYPWLASDVGFIGTLGLIGALAYLFGLAWGQALVTASARWTALLFLLFVVFYYVPANNQVFQSGETCIGFFMLLWMVRRRPPRLRTAAPPTAPVASVVPP